MTTAVADEGQVAFATTTDPTRVVSAIDRVRRALRYATGDGGALLWRVHNTERICAPLLEAVLATHGISEDRAFRVHGALEHLRGVDELPWHERLEPLSQALALLEGEELPPQALLLETLIPRGELIETVDLPPEAAEPEPEPSARGRNKRKKVRSKKAPAPPPEPEVEEEPPEPPPPLPTFPLDHPEHTGRSIGELAARGMGAPQPLLDALAARGVCTVADLLRLAPEDHDRLTALDPEAPLPEEGEVAVTGEIAARWTSFSPAGRAEELFLRQGERVFVCRWRGAAPEDIAALAVGEALTVVGDLGLDEDQRPRLYEPLRWIADSRGAVRRPIYDLEGADEAGLRRLMRAALNGFADQLEEPLPSRVLRDGRMPELGEAFKVLHVPSASPRRSLERFIFEELFLHQLGSAARKPTKLRGTAHPITHEVVSQLQLLHGIELSDSQLKAFDDIRRDLRRAQAMTRLLQGDVGAGKSVVALLAAVLVSSARSQVLFLAPDAQAAEHRFLFAEPLLRSVGVVPQLLLDPDNESQIDAIRRGASQVIFAPHSLADSPLPEFRKLGLVVVEERDNFGVIDRGNLAQRGVHPDLLVTTTVPIPTSLVFTVFQDYTLSIIDVPAVQQVETRVGSQEGRDAIYARVREQLESGRQAYVVFPLIEGRDLIGLTKARQLAQSLANEAFPGFRIATYHGAMPREERIRVFDDFQHRRIDLLLATTTIEDAPEVANATAMVIEYADRYDLVRLHRLRGYVSKGNFPGFCGLLLSESPRPEARELVDLVAREQDGYAIAERDRLNRGDEALLGELTRDVPSFTWADTARDRELLLRARRVAFSVLGQDPQLRQNTHRSIANMVGIQSRPVAKAASNRRGRRRTRRRRR